LNFKISLKTFCSPGLFLSLKKQPTFRDAISGHGFSFREMTSEKRVQKFFILMTFHFPDLGSASDWLKICSIYSEARETFEGNFKKSNTNVA